MHVLLRPRYAANNGPIPDRHVSWLLTDECCSCRVGGECLIGGLKIVRRSEVLIVESDSMTRHIYFLTLVFFSFRLFKRRAD